MCEAFISCMWIIFETCSHNKESKLSKVSLLLGQIWVHRFPQQEGGAEERGVV